MRRWLIVALAVTGCAAGDPEFGFPEADQQIEPFDMGDGDVRIDMEVDCGVEQIDGGCAPVDPCVAVDEAHPPGSCVDADGDCHPERCEASIEAALMDCDDTRADVFPGALELCNARDDDCDGRVDEGYAVGSSCAACDAPGKLECHRTDPLATACSTALGQSAGPEAPTDERCDGVDQDCDGRIDEGCALAAADDLAGLRVCRDVVVVQRDARLESAPRDDEPLVFAERGTVPTCRGGVLAWLALTEASICEGAPIVCSDATLFVAGRPLLTGALGRPNIGAAGVELTEQTPDGPRAIWVPMDSGPAVELARDLTTPTGTVHGVIGRSATLPAEVVRVVDGVRYTLDAPPAAPGEPVVGGGFAAWITEGSAPILWLVSLPDGVGLQIGAALPGRPWIVESGLYWVDADGLQRFDLVTGQRRQVVGGPLDPGRVDVGAGGIGWVNGDVLRLSPLP